MNVVNEVTSPSEQSERVEQLVSCPFCGGRVVEVVPCWNLAHAQCSDCGEEWGHCGSKYEGRYEKWNKRATDTIDSEHEIFPGTIDALNRLGS